MKCENCNKWFDNAISISQHVTWNTLCKQYYYDKYKISGNFPWKPCRNITIKVICEICGKICSGKSGIVTHVITYSKKCFDGYILKYGNDRTKWPLNTRLSLNYCKECGKEIEIRSTHCKKCMGHYSHNKSKKSRKRMSVTMSKNWKSREYKINNKKGRLNSPNTIENNIILKEKTRTKMLSGQAARMVSQSRKKFPSQPQLKLFNLIKEIFYDCEFEYVFQYSNLISYSIDIAIPRIKLAIEHDLRHWDTKKDQERDSNLESMGWKVIRFTNPDIVKDEILQKLQEGGYL